MKLIHETTNNGWRIKSKRGWIYFNKGEHFDTIEDCINYVVKQGNLMEKTSRDGSTYFVPGNQGVVEIDKKVKINLVEPIEIDESELLDF